MTITVEIKGLRELDKALRELGAEVGAKTLRSALRDAAKPVLEQAQRDAPPDVTGNLRKQLKLRTSINRRGKRGRAEVARVRVGVTKVPYIAAIEFGTSRQEAKPFLRQSLIENSAKSLDIFKDRLAVRIEQVRKRNARR